MYGISKEQAFTERHGIAQRDSIVFNKEARTASGQVNKLLVGIQGMCNVEKQVLGMNE